MNRALLFVSLVLLASMSPVQAENPQAETDAPAGQESEPTPVQVGYDMPMDGFVALDFNEKATGRLKLTVMGRVDPMGGADTSQETEVDDAEIESPEGK